MIGISSPNTYLEVLWNNGIYCIGTSIQTISIVSHLLIIVFAIGERIVYKYIAPTADKWISKNVLKPN